MTARNGVTSALLVRYGWTGVDDVFSGKDNFFQAYNPKADPSGLLDKLDVRYEVARTNIKKWPVGSPIQAALDALEVLRELGAKLFLEMAPGHVSTHLVAALLPSVRAVSIADRGLARSRS